MTNDFFAAHDDDGFWTEVATFLHCKPEERDSLARNFLALFPSCGTTTSGDVEQFCRYAVWHLLKRFAERNQGNWLREVLSGTPLSDKNDGHDIQF
jgi:hypothetical protein